MRRVTFALICAAVIAFGSSVPAQERARPPAPPRDATQQRASTGTAVIRGRVLAGDTGRPLRRAEVTLRGGFGGQPRTTSTGLDGRYELRDLPAGRFTLEVRRSSYLTLRYGQLRPLEQGRPLDVRDGQTLERIDFTLPRAGVISGRVVDELGDPVAGVPVFAMRTAFWRGRRQLVPAGRVSRTDDAGDYRVGDLMPGTYVVMAHLRETWTVREGDVDRTLGYAPTYAPATAIAAEAQRITLRAGEQLRAIDLALVPGRAANVSGTATDAAGRALAGRYVTLGQEILGPAGGMHSGAGSTVAADDGTFTIRNVPPGQYRIRVRSANDDAGGRAAVEAMVMPLTVDGVDITGLALTTASGWSLSGYVATDDGGVPQTRAAGFSLVAAAVDPDTTPDDSSLGIVDGSVRDDWTVKIGGIFGAVRLRPRVPDGWWVKAIMSEGRDVSDTPVEMRNGLELSVRVIVSPRITSVRGQLVDGKDVPRPNGTVLVFARDPEKWFEHSRWVRAVRSDQNGSYRIDGLPPGDYLAVALDYVEEDAWHERAFLESLRDAAQAFTLAEGEAHSIAVEFVAP